MDNSKTVKNFTAYWNEFIQNIFCNHKILKNFDQIQNPENFINEYNLLHTLIDNLPDLIYLKDKESRFIICNNTMALHIGVKSPDELVGKKDADFYKKEIASDYLSDEQNIIKTGKPIINKEEKIIDYNGNEKWLLTTKIPLKNNNNEIVGIIGISRNITGIKESENNLTEKYFLFLDNKIFSFKIVLQNLIDNSTDNIYFKDEKGRFVLINKSQANWLGLDDAAQAIGKTDFDYFSDEHAKRAKKDELSILKNRQSISIEEEDIWLNGRKAWVLTKKYPLYNEKNKIIGTFGVTRDITQRKMAEDALFVEKERLNATLMSIGDAVISTDKEGNIVCMNSIAEKLTGWPEDEAKGKRIKKVFNIIHENDHRKAFNPIDIVLEKNRIIRSRGDILLINKNGDEIPIKDTSSPIHNKKGKISGAVLVFHDDTEAREKSNRMSYRATHDALTGLFNRTVFEKQLYELISNTKKYNKKHAFLYLDLDKFKPVNDSCGHVAGDHLLKNLSKIIQLLLRDTDILARLGGDEFGILLKNCSLKHAQVIANKIIQALKEYRFIWDEMFFNIGVSIGIVPINQKTENKESLLVDADIAMYIAKEEGGNRVHTSRKGEKNKSKTQWESKINIALQHNLFKLYIQPIISIASKNDKHSFFEILIRMLDDKNNIILPNTFIATAEHYGLMPKIDRWVIKDIFTHISKLDQKDNSITYFINLSGTSMNDDKILSFIKEQFSNYDIFADSICFELNETSAITNIVKVIDFIKQTKKLGCRFSLDNVGLSSLNYLKYLSVDFLKIDSSFIENIDDDIFNYTSVKAIHEIANVKKIKTIANFVETNEVQAKLNEIGIDYVQGYHIGMPTPLNKK